MGERAPFHCDEALNEHWIKGSARQDGAVDIEEIELEGWHATKQCNKDDATMSKRADEFESSVCWRTGGGGSTESHGWGKEGGQLEGESRLREELLTLTMHSVSIITYCFRVREGEAVLVSLLKDTHI